MTRLSIFLVILLKIAFVYNTPLPNRLNNITTKETSIVIETQCDVTTPKVVIISMVCLHTKSPTKLLTLKVLTRGHNMV